MAYLSGELSMDGGLKASVMSDATAPRMHCIGSALQVAHTARAHDCGYLSILKYLGSICLHRIPAEDIPALASQARLQTTKNFMEICCPGPQKTTHALLNCRTACCPASCRRYSCHRTLPQDIADARISHFQVTSCNAECAN